MIPKRLQQVFNQIFAELWLAHESYSMVMGISNQSERLKGSPYEHAFGLQQRFALSQLVLSTCNLFEKYNKKYPNHSLPTAIALINEHYPQGTPPLDNLQFIKALKFLSETYPLCRMVRRR